MLLIESGSPGRDFDPGIEVSRDWMVSVMTTSQTQIDLHACRPR